MILTQPAIAKSVLRYTLKEMHASFYSVDKARPVDIPYSVVGNGLFFTAGIWRPGDMELYVMLAAAEYVLATKDLAMLNETVWFYDSDGSGGSGSGDNRTHSEHSGHVEHTILAALQRIVHYSIDVVGVGPHGMMRMMTSDWDDGLSCGSSAEVLAKSESALSSATATYTLPKIAQVLRLAGDEVNATRAEAFAAGQRKALLTGEGEGEGEVAWNGQWLRRAWCSNGTGGNWLGDVTGTKPGVFTPQHGFAMLGGAFDQAPEQLATVVALLTTRCRAQDFPFGIPYRCEAKPVGEAACPGMWPALTHPLILGLARMNQVRV
jgi:hypothetical protein